jgi:hypothetical protein
LLLKLFERAFVGDRAFGVEMMDVDFHAGTASALQAPAFYRRSTRDLKRKSQHWKADAAAR